MEQQVQQLDQKEMQLIRALTRSLTREQFADMCELLDITDRGFYKWLNRAEYIPYQKLVTICDFMSEVQQRNFTITDLLSPAKWFHIAPKPPVKRQRVRP